MVLETLFTLAVSFDDKTAPIVIILVLVLVLVWESPTLGCHLCHLYGLSCSCDNKGFSKTGNTGNTFQL